MWGFIWSLIWPALAVFAIAAAYNLGAESTLDRRLKRKADEFRADMERLSVASSDRLRQLMRGP